MARNCAQPARTRRARVLMHGEDMSAIKHLLFGSLFVLGCAAETAQQDDQTSKNDSSRDPDLSMLIGNESKVGTFFVQGDTAKQLWDAMPIKAIDDECTGGRIKQVGELSCSEDLGESGIHAPMYHCNVGVSLETGQTKRDEIDGEDC